MCLFSIIVPVYNVAPYLRECLESLLAQTCSDWEAICVDDGSTDGSGLILDEYVVRDARFRKMSKRNGGLSSARNAALPYVKGEWVGFLDSDDKIEPNWLSSVAASVLEEKVDLIRLGFKFWFSDDKVGLSIRGGRAYPSRTIEGNHNVCKWGWNEWVGGAWVWLSFIRREVLFRSGVTFSEKALVMEDIIFDATLLPYLTKVKQIDCNGYLYRQREGSLWHKPRLSLCTIRIFAEFQRIYESQRLQLKLEGLTKCVFVRMLKIVWWESHAWVLTHPKEDGRNKGDVLLAARHLIGQVIGDLPQCQGRIKSGLVTSVIVWLCGNFAAHYALAKAMKVRRFAKDRLLRD